MNNSRMWVVVRRANGQFVKDILVHSKYAAKVAKRRLEEKFDNRYSIELEKEKPTDD